MLNNLPGMTDDLVDRLDEMYPPRCIGQDESPEAAHRYAGKRELIEQLLYLRERTTHEGLTYSLEND